MGFLEILFLGDFPDIRFKKTKEQVA